MEVHNFDVTTNYVIIYSADSIISCYNGLLKLKLVMVCLLLQVELRAFCSKHSNVQGRGNASSVGDVAVGSDYPASNPGCGKLSRNKLQKLKIDSRGSDKNAEHMECSDAHSERFIESEEREFSASRLDSRPVSESGGAQNLADVDILDRNGSEHVKPSDSIDYNLILKKVLQ